MRGGGNVQSAGTLLSDLRAELHNTTHFLRILAPNLTIVQSVLRLRLSHHSLSTRDNITP